MLCAFLSNLKTEQLYFYSTDFDKYPINQLITGKRLTIHEMFFGELFEHSRKV